ATFVIDKWVYFPSARKARVGALGASQIPDALARWHAALGGYLEADGFRVDPRPFVPHVTLARFSRPPASEPAPFNPVSWTLDNLVLYESVSGPEGSTYQGIQEFRLARSGTA